MVDFTRFMRRDNLEPRFAPMPIKPAPQVKAPAPTPIAPPPAPLPSVEPAPMPAPVAPLPNISGLPDLSNIDLSGLPGLPQMPLPAPVAAPAPAPAPVPVTPPPLPPTPVAPPPAPEPAVGIETLAPDDFTMPAGIAAGPMSTPAVNNRVEAMEANIPMPDGSQFNLESLDVGGFEIDPQIIQNALADAGLAPPPVAEPAPAITPNLDAGLTLGDTFLTEPRVDLSNERELAETMRGGSANRGDVVAPTPEPTPTASSFQPEAGGFTLTPEQQASIDAAIGSGSFSLIDDSYGFTDGQQDAAGVIPGAGAAANAATNASTNPNAGQDWYENMTDEQRESYDAFIAGGGLANIPGGTIDLTAIGGGTVNIPGYGGYTGTTPRPVVDPIQNLSANRAAAAADPRVASAYQLGRDIPVQRPSSNPFVRPESQQGIGSLASGG